MNLFAWRRAMPQYLMATALLCLAGALPSKVRAQDGCANQSATLPSIPAQAPGLGGTGLQAIKPGVGGTGIDDPGLGGTGIVGVITGFASVCVNGVEVHFDDSTPINENGQPASMNALAVGKVVAIQAQAKGTEFVARRISVLNSVEGPVDAVHLATGTLSVLGQTVTVPAGVAFGAIQVGQWVQASGHRRAMGQIEASYLNLVAPQGLARMTGLVERTMGVDLVVSGTEVHLAGAPGAVRFLRGDEVTVAGIWDGRTLRAQSVLKTGNQQQLGRIQALVVEGYVHALSAQNISLGGASFALAPGVEVQGARGQLQDVAVDQLVRMTGRVDERQELRINRIEIRRTASGRGPSDPARRSGDDDGRDRSGSSDSSERSGSSDSSGSSGSSESSGSSGSSSGSGSSGKSGSSGSSGSSGKGK